MLECNYSLKKKKWSINWSGVELCFGSRLYRNHGTGSQMPASSSSCLLYFTPQPRINATFTFREGHTATASSSLPQGCTGEISKSFKSLKSKISGCQLRESKITAQTSHPIIPWKVMRVCLMRRPLLKIWRLSCLNTHEAIRVTCYFNVTGTEADRRS